jgi:hypothetical protein
MLPVVIDLYKIPLNSLKEYKLNFSILLAKWEIFKYLYLVGVKSKIGYMKWIVDTIEIYISLTFGKRISKA